MLILTRVHYKDLTIPLLFGGPICFIPAIYLSVELLHSTTSQVLFETYSGFTENYINIIYTSGIFSTTHQLRAVGKSTHKYTSESLCLCRLGIK